MSKKTCFLPCAKFCIAAGLTAGSFVFGAVMLATGGATAPLTPFYCSLITSSIVYWVPSPKVYNTREVKSDEDESLINR